MVECDGLVHIYKSDGLEVVALQGLDLRVAEGEMLAIVGRSGSGKTTLMNILAGMEPPSAGRVQVAGQDLAQMGEGERDRYRREVVGYLWQNSQLNLTPELTAVQNVQLPLAVSGCPPRLQHARAVEALAVLGLEDRQRHHPGQLSGGEQQRLALAVALANGPRLLLADEPTAELDSATAQGVLADLREAQRTLGTTVVMVTHDAAVERYVERVIRIRDGRTSTETRWVESAGTVVADELVIMDRAGRLQLPPAYVEALGLKDRVRIHLEADHLRIVPLEEGEGRRETK
jgi:ABC-type lipoprotein export system ATPase subunit